MINTMRSDQILGAFLLALAIAVLFEIVFSPITARASGRIYTQTAEQQSELIKACAHNATLCDGTTPVQPPAVRYMTADGYRAQFAIPTTTATTTPLTTIQKLIAEIAFLQAELKALTK
jgi:hypothetical protein